MSVLTDASSHAHVLILGGGTNAEEEHLRGAKELSAAS